HCLPRRPPGVRICDLHSIEPTAAQTLFIDPAVPHAAGGAAHPSHAYIPGRLTRGVRLTYLGAILFPFAGAVTAIALLWGWGFSWVHLGRLVGMYVATAVGVTVGYHRLFTHKAFETTAPVKFILAVLGAMA